MSQPDNIREALERIAQNNAMEDDRRLIHQALLSGNIFYRAIERNANIEGDISGAIIITGSKNNISINLSADDYEKLKETVFSKPQGIVPPFPNVIFIGREESVTIIKKRLGILGKNPTPTRTVILHGIPGVGKTTLVSALSRDPSISKVYPDGVLWARLGKEPDFESTFREWAHYLERQDFRSLSVKEVFRQLSIFLQHKRILLIVDDVWTPAHGADFQALRGTNCGLLITTRLTYIADQLGPSDLEKYQLPILNESAALKLMKILAPEVVSKHLAECKELLRDIEYLPLAIHVAARLLKAELRNGLGVEELLNDIRIGAALMEAPAPAPTIENGEIPTVKALLQKSTDILDPQTRDCFAYLGAIKPDSTLDVSIMKAIWRMDSPLPTINKLVSYGLLQPAGKGRFQMHALLVKHARSLFTNNL